MATSCSGGGSRSIRRDPPTMGKQLVNIITCGCESSAPFFVIYKFTDLIYICRWVRVVMFSSTINNISVISWWSVLLVEDIGVPGENHRPVTSHWRTLYHIMLYRVHLDMSEVLAHNVSVDNNECIGSYKSNYHTFMTTTVQTQQHILTLIRLFSVH